MIDGNNMAQMDLSVKDIGTLLMALTKSESSPGMLVDMLVDTLVAGWGDVRTGGTLGVDLSMEDLNTLIPAVTGLLFTGEDQPEEKAEHLVGLIRRLHETKSDLQLSIDEN